MSLIIFILNHIFISKTVIAEVMEEIKLSFVWKEDELRWWENW